MGKIWIEVCLISARGLRRTSSLWKLQWFAVGWIEPNNKYCTKIDASGNANPIWKTKFATLVDDSNFQDMALHVEVYSREPIFLRERLQGTATVVLKEFLAKYSSNSAARKEEEVGSYQLRKGNSNKPQGFVDVFIRISEDRGDPGSYAGNGGGIVLMDRSNNVVSPSEGGSGQAYPSEMPLQRQENQAFSGSGQAYTSEMPLQRQENQAFSGSGQAYPSELPLRRQENQAFSGSGQAYPSELPIRRRERQASSSAYPHQMPYSANYSNPSMGVSSYPAAAGPNYHPPCTPPPPPPPSNIGYVPTVLPNTDYINMPSSVAAPRAGARPGLAMGLGAGALAAGAVIFGDDFMSGFDIPPSLPDPSLTITTDPPF